MKVLVIDNGLYVELALTLGRSELFDQVGYFTEWREDFPYTKERVIGAGFDEIVREMDLFDAIEEYEAFVFPDNYWAGLQRALRANGMPVWGSGDAEELELDRTYLRKLMVKAGLPIPSTMTAFGIPELLESGTIDEGDFVKISRYRGLMETTKFAGWDSPDWLWDVAKDLGPFANDFPFMVEKPLEGVEIGFDGIVVGGKLLYPCLLGIEKKDAGYLGKVVDTLPGNQAVVAGCLQNMFDSTYNNFLSVELRGPVLLDITTRMPQPPGHGMLSIFKDIPYFISAQLNNQNSLYSEGYGKWLSMIVLKRTHNDRYMRVKLEGEAKKYAKFSRMFKYQNELWIAPGKANEIGTVSGIGETADDAQQACLDALEGIKADDFYTTGAEDGFKELLNSWLEAEREGVN